MRGVFDEEELEPVRPRRDTELTLGSGTLLVIFFGLVAVCGLCFGLGYAMGHRSAQNAPVASTDSNTPAAPVSASLAKPSAGAQTPAADAASQANNGQAGALTASASAQNAAAASPAQQTVASAAGTNAQSQVHPAFTAGGAATSPTTATASAVRPALQPAGTFMVQIAAVSNQEDADVLTSALRKRGYTVSEKREPIDNLIHVRIGPFVTAGEANNWKNRLLNDGYNAIVQQ